MVYVTWPRWPPCPYMIKTFKNLLRWNRKADDLETWYTASSTRVQPSFFKWCPWFDLDVFYGKVKFGPLVWENIKTMDFSETTVVYDREFGRRSQLGEYMTLYEYQRSRSFTDLGQNHSDSIFLSFFSSLTVDFNIHVSSAPKAW